LETGTIERFDIKEVSFRKGGKSTFRLGGNCLGTIMQKFIGGSFSLSKMVFFIGDGKLLI